MVGVSSSASAQQVIAHRGASFDAPENTVAAFKEAWKQGADGIEGDFYLTSDGQIACIHDKNTKRVAVGQPVLKVAESTMEELKSVEVGAWKDPKFKGEKIPTLSEVIETIPPGKQFFVEIKCGPEILPELKKQLTTSDLTDDQVVLICFNEEVIRKARQMMPQYKANWLTSYKRSTPVSKWAPSQTQVVSKLQNTKATGLGTNGNLSVVNESFADAVKASGVELHIWTVNDPAHAKQFASLGAASLTTDRPAFIREQLN
ncbi:Glycerophosphoryl diester phosphodiesterase [Roseimaritima multifibrata]|uniref:Glycerophosphoryl diester phosphodiesterase n=2 Tax=Roseimaritima multifibrata TaxID=1930274 RepID=A0A517MEH6_9BACT|nr:Glycerophosphoryl diester phosphodiesterase [Roseimaritima multifibrata]